MTNGLGKQPGAFVWRKIMLWVSIVGVLGTLVSILLLDEKCIKHKWIAFAMYGVWAMAPLVYLVWEYCSCIWFVDDEKELKKYEHLQGLVQEYWKMVVLVFGVLIAVKFGVKF